MNLKEIYKKLNGKEIQSSLYPHFNLKIIYNKNIIVEFYLRKDLSYVDMYTWMKKPTSNTDIIFGDGSYFNDNNYNLNHFLRFRKDSFNECKDVFLFDENHLLCWRMIKEFEDLNGFFELLPNDLKILILNNLDSGE